MAGTTTKSPPTLSLGAPHSSLDWNPLYHEPTSVPVTPPRTLVPIAPNGEANPREETSKRKQPKSRNGCVTCKARRRKCDEAKPTCYQCLRRNIKCGGYSKDLRWKPVKKIQDVPVVENEEASRSTSLLLPDRHGVVAESAWNARTSSQDVFYLPLFSDLNQDARPLFNPFNAISEDAIAEPILDDLELDDLAIQNVNDDVLIHGQPLRLDDLDLLLSTTATAVMPRAGEAHQNQSLASDISVGEPHSLDWQDSPTALVHRVNGDGRENILESAWQMSTIDHTMEGTTPPFAWPSLSSVPSEGECFVTWYQQPRSKSIDPATIRHLFDIHTCGILSIKDDQARNPWKTLIWPLAYNNPILYHALAAMTCLQLGRTQPELRDPGIQHFRRSIQALITSEPENDISLESALATRLALGWAECWDHQKPSTGISHIKIAKNLVRKAVSKHQASRLAASELSRLSFLANTWIYMDVIARFSCIDDGGPTDFDFMNTCSLLSPIPLEQQIDPLMGCAFTLFPLIGRLADLVRRVRRRTEKSNSPATISKGLDLRIAIEQWAPPIDVEQSESVNPNISDQVQTAEAYRWAALLMLRQTIPELPSSRSMWELAQKVLIFLATVPHTSGTMIVQIFPMMVAGCEAVGEEDRDWVRERWDLMSKRMIAGVIDRCKEITDEVWQRRDAYAASRDLCNNIEDHSSEVAFDPEGRATASQWEGCTEPQPISFASDFPKSVAFKKDIDPLTMAGNIKYTVRGELHWLSVMREWNWEVMLG